MEKFSPAIFATSCNLLLRHSLISVVSIGLISAALDKQARNERCIDVCAIHCAYTAVADASGHMVKAAMAERMLSRGMLEENARSR